MCLQILRILQSIEIHILQAESLSSRLGKEDSKIIEEIELIAVSPLQRALQTMEISLFPHVWPGNVPIIALPQASERVYLISDFGTSTKELKNQYPIVDFDTERCPYMIG